MAKRKALIYSTILAAMLDLDRLARMVGVETLALVLPHPRPDDLKRASQVKALIDAAPDHLPVRLVTNKDELAQIVCEYSPDLGLCIGYPWKFSAEILALHPLGVLNGHPSILPRHRGPFPVAWAIRQGDPVLGLTMQLMGAEFDTGPIIVQGSRSMLADTSPEIMGPLFASLNGELIPQAVEKVINGDRGSPQAIEGITWAGPFEDAYREIDWSQSAAAIDRQVRAWQWMSDTSKIQGPLTTIDGKRVRVLQISLKQPVNGLGFRIETGDEPVWVTSTVAMKGTK